MKVNMLQLINGNLVPIEKDVEFENEQDPIDQQIMELKQNLADTDYKAIKYAEGLLSDTEYAPIKAQRQEWRLRINELEEILMQNNPESEE